MIILEALFFALPIYTANAFASLSMSIPVLKDWSTPIDFGKSIDGKRILGNGKTFRGLIFGIFCGILMGILQYKISENIEFSHISKFSESSLSFFILLSSLLGFGALFGDIVKSLVKRRIGIKRGRPWPPFDQLDFIFGGFFLSFAVYFPGWKILLILLLITPILHLSANIISYKLKLKDVWW